MGIHFGSFVGISVLMSGFAWADCQPERAPHGNFATSSLQQSLTALRADSSIADLTSQLEIPECESHCFNPDSPYSFHKLFQLRRKVVNYRNDHSEKQSNPAIRSFLNSSWRVILAMRADESGRCTGAAARTETTSRPESSLVPRNDQPSVTASQPAVQHTSTRWAKDAAGCPGSSTGFIDEPTLSDFLASMPSTIKKISEELVRNYNHAYQDLQINNPGTFSQYYGGNISAREFDCNKIQQDRNYFLRADRLNTFIDMQRRGISKHNGVSNFKNFLEQANNICVFRRYKRGMDNQPQFSLQPDTTPDLRPLEAYNNLLVFCSSRLANTEVRLDCQIKRTAYSNLRTRLRSCIIRDQAPTQDVTPPRQSSSPAGES